jgi:hypothetical protein
VSNLGFATGSAPRSDAQDPPRVVPDPDQSEADGESDRIPANRQTADDVGGMWVNTVDDLRVEVRDPEGAAPADQTARLSAVRNP